MSALMHHAQHTAGNVGNQLQRTAGHTFLAVQATLIGVPLFLFAAFALTTLLISLSTCLLLAFTTAFIYTFFAVGIALLFLIPTLFFASCAATCFFLWGLALYMILRRLNKGEQPSKKGTRVGDKLHALTGGRLEHMAESEERNGHSREMDQAQEIPRTNGVADGHRGGNASRLGGDGHVNANGEWEAKWSEGTQRKQVEFAKNVDVKVEMVPLES